MLTCQKCHKEIEDLMYVKLQPQLIMQKYKNPIPPIFSCVESQENYATEIILHDTCFINLLKEMGIKIHDMKEVIAKHNKLAEEKKKNNSK